MHRPDDNYDNMLFMIFLCRNDITDIQCILTNTIRAITVEKGAQGLP